MQWFFPNFFQTIEEWRLVFFISSLLYLFGCVVYWMWSSGELQTWAQKSSVTDSKQKPTDAATYVGYANEGLEMSE